MRQKSALAVGDTSIESIRPDVSKPPGEIAFDRVVLDAVGELTCVGEADLRLASDLQIGTRLD
jgi:hypothetical protein